jgi:hypothetical protein
MIDSISKEKLNWVFFSMNIISMLTLDTCWEGDLEMYDLMEKLFGWMFTEREPKRKIYKRLTSERHERNYP